MNDFPDSQPWPRVDLDMDQVTRRALGVRAWRCDFSCDGVPFTATVDAANEAAAHSLARCQLAANVAGFVSERATLTACVQV